MKIQRKFVRAKWGAESRIHSEIRNVPAHQEVIFNDPRVLVGACWNRHHLLINAVSPQRNRLRATLVSVPGFAYG
jgi:hypothetical protein